MASTKKALVGLLEKAFWTWVQVFAATMAMASAVGADVAQAAMASSVAAALTVVANGLPTSPVEAVSAGVDLIYRVVRTFAVTVVPILAAVPLWDWDVNFFKGAALLAGPAVFSVIKGFASTRIGSPDTAAALSLSIDPGAGTDNGTSA